VLGGDAGAVVAHRDLDRGAAVAGRDRESRPEAGVCPSRSRRSAA
jgi:hypothetical protein